MLAYISPAPWLESLFTLLGASLELPDLAQRFSRASKEKHSHLLAVLFDGPEGPFLLESVDSHVGRLYHPRVGSQSISCVELLRQRASVRGLVIGRGKAARGIAEHLLQARAARSTHVPQPLAAPNLKPSAIISLFDGSGSFAETVSHYVGRPPVAILEFDNTIRPTIAHFFQYDLSAKRAQCRFQPLFLCWVLWLRSLGWTPTGQLRFPALALRSHLLSGRPSLYRPVRFWP